MEDFGEFDPSIIDKMVQEGAIEPYPECQRGVEEVTGPSPGPAFDVAEKLRGVMFSEPQKVLVFDTETTGLDPVQCDIVQIAMIVVVDGKEMDGIDLKCRPFNPAAVCDKALEVQRRTLGQIMQFDNPHFTYQAVLMFFEKYIDKYDKEDKFIPAGQNVRFDLDFLYNWFKKCDPLNKYGMGLWIDRSRAVDLSAIVRALEWARVISPMENHRLETICAEFGVKLTGAHDAMADVRATADALGFVNGILQRIPYERRTR